MENPKKEQEKEEDTIPDFFRKEFPDLTKFWEFLNQKDDEK